MTGVCGVEGMEVRGEVRGRLRGRGYMYNYS